MSTFVLVIGKSGRGKSLSMRNLPPEETFLVNVVGKALPFPNGSLYVEDKNLLTSADAAKIIQTMMHVSSKMSHVKYLIIDDVQYIMASEFMSKAFVKTYDKFTLMAKNIWDIMVLSSRLRGDLKVCLLAHEESSEGHRRMKTLGKLLEEKITPEGLSSIVLFSEVSFSKDRGGIYYFTTQSDGDTTAKSPPGMFPMYIDNDLKNVFDRIDEYYRGVSLKDSAIVLDSQGINERKPNEEVKMT